MAQLKGHSDACKRYELELGRLNYHSWINLNECPVRRMIAFHIRILMILLICANCGCFRKLRRSGISSNCCGRKAANLYNQLNCLAGYTSFGLHRMEIAACSPSPNCDEKNVNKKLLELQIARQAPKKFASISTSGEGGKSQQQAGKKGIN